MSAQVRTRRVLGALVLCMSLGTAVLLWLKPDPLQPQTAFSLSAVGEMGPVEGVFDTSAAIEASRWQYIIIHHSGTSSGNATTLGEEHTRRGFGGLGYQFVIGNGSGAGDGEIQVGYRWDGQLDGAHTQVPGYDFNRTSIGICIVGNGSTTPFTNEQISRLTQLSRLLQARLGIPSSNILLHSELKNTACPGPLFPVERFRLALH